MNNREKEKNKRRNGKRFSFLLQNVKNSTHSDMDLII
jgi:hypothetical protein